MKFFIDTANVEEIKKANDMGIICGVTTNPSLIAKEGRDFNEVIKEIASIVDGAISGEVKVLIIDNNGDNEGSTESRYVYSVPTSESAGVILATGDVTVSGDWNGLIVCGGKLTVTGASCELVHNPDNVGKAMQMSCDVAEESFKVVNFFTSGNNYVAGSFGDKAEMTDVRNCISYENYKSE